MSPVTRGFVAAFASLLVTAALVAPVAAQQVYRIVGPDGRVTFSDKPPETPPATSNRPGTATGAPAAQTTPQAATGPALPFALKQIAVKYPVVFYSGNGCAPCSAGRALLVGRGIPFTEKTIVANEDIEALQRLSGGATLPFLTIGGQQIKGYSEIEWSQFLDAAGYPKTSQLPQGYRNAQASPLVSAQNKAAEQAAANAQRPPASAATGAADAPEPPPPAEPAPASPSGIRF